jgi:uncharacterized lipoprotein YddW (UPF0748 family)
MRRAFTFVSALVALACPSFADDPAPPPVPREFRAVWVASVANIDWPSKPGLSVEEQKREAVGILDLTSKMNMNAVVLQVRPAADALYDSKLEPWSAYLTGKQGQAPDPSYDPLTFWVEEAHRRGLQLHAWFNPFRARQQGARFDESSDHVSKRRPDLVRAYGGLLWLDPGEPEAREHTLGVILDVVRRYDVDGVHLDDYFYPYPVNEQGTGKELSFPDDASYQRYRDSGGALRREDWRRDCINKLIEQIYVRVKKEKRHVQFGISPFGIPRPGQPEGVKGFDQYEKLYADAVHWLNRGWCDYFSPQLYWRIDSPGQPFRPLLNEWLRQNTQKRHVWPGLSVGRSGGDELVNQISILRDTPGATGHVLFSQRSLRANRGGVATRLEERPYRSPAVVPESPWTAGPAPGKPVAEWFKGDGGRVALRLKSGAGVVPAVYAVQSRRGQDWSLRVVSGAQPSEVEAGEGVSEMIVTPFGRLGERGEAVRIGPPG